MIEIKNKKDCSGCHACASICPRNCISMIADNEGFLYPSIDKSKCIECGLCKKACPILNQQIDNKAIPKAFACFNKNEKIRLKSTSGGVFSALAEQILKQDGVVFGAAFNQEMEVVHQAIKSLDGLEKLRMSKYVQSRIGDSFKKAREFLQAGKIVLFTGTPCQIEGLKAYLKKDYDNLLTQDLICHGVPSPAILKEYIKYRQTEANQKISNIEFRSKQRGWNKKTFALHYENGNVSTVSAVKDGYMNMFFFNKNLRPSCHDCKFKKIGRLSDITLADFWGLKNVGLPHDFDDNKGVSLVLVHSQKGAAAFEMLKESIVSIEVDFEKSVKKNPMIKSSTWKHFRRAKVMQDFKKLPFNKFLKKHGKILI